MDLKQEFYDYFNKYFDCSINDFITAVGVCNWAVGISAKDKQQFIIDFLEKNKREVK